MFPKYCEYFYSTVSERAVSLLYICKEMPSYFDIENMELGNSHLRAQYVIQYAIKIILVCSRTVSEAVRSSSSEIQMHLARAVEVQIEYNEVIIAALA